jgi:integrase
MAGEAELLPVCRIAYASGLRLGELSALTWADVDLTGSVLHVRRTWTDGRLGTPKSGQRRDVDLTTDAVHLLADEWAACDRPSDDCLVFPGATATGYLAQRSVAAGLYAAMKRAGIPREAGNGERRSFHSFRHAHAAACLASGMSLYVVSRRLGHSAIQTTTSLYGHLAVDERKRQAQLLEGVFAF